MASVVAVSASATASPSTTHVAALPSGIVAGDLLLMATVADGHGTGTAFTWPADWTYIGSPGASAPPNGSARAEIFYRIADGAEGPSITISGNSEGWASHAWRVIGHHGEGPARTSTASDTGNANAPTLTPAWGSAANLWIAIAAFDNLATVTGYPTGYTGNQRTTQSGATASDVTIASATKVATAISDDAGAFTNTSRPWMAFTLAIQPAASGVGASGVLLNQGETVMLNAFTAKTPGQVLRLRLFKNDVTPAETDTEATYTQATFTGYPAGGISLPAASATTVAGEPSQTTFPPQRFTATVDQSAQTIYGYYYVQTSSGLAVAAERFATPYVIQRAGDALDITPTISMG